MIGWCLYGEIKVPFCIIISLIFNYYHNLTLLVYDTSTDINSIGKLMQMYYIFNVCCTTYIYLVYQYKCTCSETVEEVAWHRGGWLSVDKDWPNLCTNHACVQYCLQQPQIHCIIFWLYYIHVYSLDWLFVLSLLFTFVYVCFVVSCIRISFWLPV